MWNPGCAIYISHDLVERRATKPNRCIHAYNEALRGGFVVTRDVWGPTTLAISLPLPWPSSITDKGHGIDHLYAQELCFLALSAAVTRSSSYVDQGILQLYREQAFDSSVIVRGLQPSSRIPCNIIFNVQTDIAYIRSGRV